MPTKQINYTLYLMTNNNNVLLCFICIVAIALDSDTNIDCVNLMVLHQMKKFYCS